MEEGRNKTIQPSFSYLRLVLTILAPALRDVSTRAGLAGVY